jgi:hypothetical protein
MRGRAIHAAAAALICAIAVGCGSDDSASQSSNSTLTPKQYTELERMYLVMAPADGLADNDDARSLRRAVRIAVRGCRQIDRSDPLLAAMVDGCEQLLGRFAAIADLDCTTARECTEMVEEISTTMRDLIETLHEMEPVVEREVGDPECRDALLTPDQTELLEKLADAFDRFSKAVTSGDADAVTTTGAEIDKVAAAMDDSPSIKQQLKTFRRDCKPVTS